MGKLSTQEHFVTKCREVHGSKYNYGQYRGMKVKIEIECPYHGIFLQIPKSHIHNKSGCPKCHSNYKLTTSEFIKLAIAKYGTLFDYSKSIYVGSKIDIIIICNKHNEEFLQKPTNHLHRGNGCSQCAGNHKLTTETFIEKANIVHNFKYDYSITEYTNSHIKCDIICLVHGIFNQLPANHLSKAAGCPKCAPSMSKQENNISRFVMSVDSSLEVKTSDRSVLGGKELDIYVPSLNFAIEFDGVYWHSEQRGKGKKYHLNKTEGCEAKGINLFHIFENEWKDDAKQNIWKSMIVNKLGASHKVYARKCKIVKLTPSESISFFDVNHLQGRGYAENCAYGLKYEGTLVSAMSFSKPRYSKSYDWELLRMCNLLGHSVTGGFSRLLKAFRKDHSGSLVSYANRRFSMGNIYDALGFEFVHNSEPSYYYRENNSMDLHHRSAFMKHKLKDKLEHFDPSLTEYENMLANGYDRIWDCGTKVYTLE